FAEPRARQEVDSSMVTLSVRNEGPASGGKMRRWMSLSAQASSKQRSRGAQLLSLGKQASASDEERSRGARLLSLGKQASASDEELRPDDVRLELADSPADGKGNNLGQPMDGKALTLAQHTPQTVHALSAMQLFEVLDVSLARVLVCVPLHELASAAGRMDQHDISLAPAKMRGFLEMWRLPEAAERFTFLRVISTALVHAVLQHCNRVVPERMRAQAAMLEQAPWMITPGRSFSWYVGVLMVVLDNIKAPGWHSRSQLLQLVFLQQPDGSFRMTKALATLLRAGYPEEPLASDPLPAFSVEELADATPKDLLALCGGNGELTRQTWATLCALAYYNQLPFEWHVNPEAPLVERETLGQQAWRWVCEAVPAALGHESLPDIVLQDLQEFQELAAIAVDTWQQQHERRCEQFQDAELVETIASDLSTASQGDKARCVGEGAAGKWRLGRAMRQFADHVRLTHPLAQIYLVHPMDCFTRGQRIIVQANTILTLLAMAIVTGYHRAVSCSAALRENLGCPSRLSFQPVVPSSACLGENDDVRLQEARQSGMLPEELRDEDFVCNEFPRRTLPDVTCAVAAMAFTILLIAALLSAVYKRGWAVVSPDHWHLSPSKPRGRLQLSTSARLLVGLASAVVDAVNRVREALVLLASIFLKPVMQSLKWCAWQCWSRTSRLLRGETVNEDDVTMMTMTSFMMLEVWSHFMVHVLLLACWMFLAGAILMSASGRLVRQKPVPDPVTPSDISPFAGYEKENFTSAPGRLEIFRASDSRSPVGEVFGSVLVTTQPLDSAPTSPLEGPSAGVQEVMVLRGLEAQELVVLEDPGIQEVLAVIQVMTGMAIATIPSVLSPLFAPSENAL
ncbi:hypothetical protein CYMTET_22412, partial [Cymbomonas tetramitiformis]